MSEVTTKSLRASLPGVEKDFKGEIATVYEAVAYEFHEHGAQHVPVVLGYFPSLELARSAVKGLGVQTAAGVQNDGKVHARSAFYCSVLKRYFLLEEGPGLELFSTVRAARRALVLARMSPEDRALFEEEDEYG